MEANYLTGAVHDMSNEDYHALPHLSSSGFKLLARSPAHYWAAHLDPDRERKAPSRVMAMGSAWHAAVFEPELFDSTYAARPDISPVSTVGKLLDELLAVDEGAFDARYVAIPDGLSKTSKEGKALMAELSAAGKIGVEESKLVEVYDLAAGLFGKTLLSADDLEAVTKMADAARRHPVSRVIFDLPGGHAETSIFWVDPETGAPCRIRPDYHVEPCAMFPHGLIIDGKSNDDSSPAGFARNAWNAEMYFQAAWYSDGYQQHYGTREPPVFAWLSQERESPFATAYYSAPADLVDYGRRRYRPLLQLFARCLATGDWPGYPAQVSPLDLPVWAAKEISGQ